MKQLSFLTTTQSPQAAYEELLCKSSPISWNRVKQLASIIEQVPECKENYQDLGLSPQQFFRSIEAIRDDYVLALKAVWWSRLIFPDRSFEWLTRENFKRNLFFQYFNFFVFNRLNSTFRINRTRLKKAQLHWQLAQNRYGKQVDFNQLEQYAAEFQKEEEVEQVQYLQKELLRLKAELEEAQKGNLVYYGIKCSNRELPPNYLELYAYAQNLSMNSIQFKHFVDVLFYQGFYPACQYADKFEPITELARA